MSTGGFQLNYDYVYLFIITLISRHWTTTLIETKKKSNDGANGMLGMVTLNQENIQKSIMEMTLKKFLRTNPCLEE